MQRLRASIQIKLDSGPLAGEEDIENGLKQTFEASNSTLYTGVLLISKMTFRTNLESRFTKYLHHSLSTCHHKPKYRDIIKDGGAASYR